MPDPGCYTCYSQEKFREKSYRISQLERFTDSLAENEISVLEIEYDNSCNLACRTCTPHYSTLWAKELKMPNQKVPVFDNVAQIISQYDSVAQLKINGGEPLMSRTYWKLLKEIITTKPEFFKDAELHVQTNGTQNLKQIHLDIFRQFRLVKLSLSIDEIEDRFEYIRWPGVWNEVVENLLDLRNTAPPNVMFNVEQTFSPLNIMRNDAVKNWFALNMPANKDGDPTSYNFHYATGNLSITSLTDELAKEVGYKFVGQHFKENPVRIKNMIRVLDEQDAARNQSWKETFPELVKYYKRYI